MSMHKSPIDYIAQSEALIGRPGRVLNIVTWRWLLDKTVQAKRFTKANAGIAGPREYPAEWSVTP